MVKSIYYHQSADEYCLHSDDLLNGFHQLGIAVYSNIKNYSFIKEGEWDINDPYFVATTGNINSDFRRSWVYYFIDGRDSDEINEGQLNDLRVLKYFKTNLPRSDSEKLKLLPSCIHDVQIKNLKNVKKDVDISFVTGHNTNRRQDVIDWLNDFKGSHPELNIINSPIWSNSVAINNRYPKAYCNFLSLDYLEVLNRSYISLNAPGGNGGVSTKKFYEILAAGCLCFNFVPQNYPQKLNNILDVIPDNINFPKDSIINFSTREELFNKLGLRSEYLEKVERSKEFASRWTCKDKAQYVLKECLNS